ncbi:MAG TPA: hypothetical protein DCM86_12220, partial [Verrucomicrobiales bacterium]|nr:hypothetical protein [Verrucomicrobiales bacterium]
MKLFRSVVIGIPVVILSLLAYGLIWPGCRAAWNYDQLERNARTAVAPEALQTWARGLLGSPRLTDSPRARDLGTNFPAPLLTLMAAPPAISINKATTNHAAYIVLTWGSGVLGQKGLEIGDTNFLGIRGGHAWAPGVYFWERSEVNQAGFSRATNRVKTPINPAPPA